MTNAPRVDRRSTRDAARAPPVPDALARPARAFPREERAATPSPTAVANSISPFPFPKRRVTTRHGVPSSPHSKALAPHTPTQVMAPGPRDGGAEAAARYRQYEYKAVRAFVRPRATTTMTTATRESTRECVILFRRRG